MGTPGERSFSSATRRLKTWLRSRMGDERFSNLAVLNDRKRKTDTVSIADVAQEFVSHNTVRETLWHCGQLQKVAMLGRFI